MDFYTERHRIRDGDVFSCHGQWLFSKLIRAWTGEYFSHVGIAMWLRFEYDDHDTLCILESMEGYGVRLQPLEHVLAQYQRAGGELYWQPIKEHLYPDFNRQKMLGFALSHWMDKYPPLYQFIVGISPVLQKTRKILGRSLDVSPGKRHCSELVADSIKYAGFYNAKISALTTPGDISNYSLLSRPELVTLGPSDTKGRFYSSRKGRLHCIL